MIARSLAEIAGELDGELLGPGDMVVSGLAGLEDAGPGDLSFVARASARDAMTASAAGALLVPAGLEPDRPAIRVADPHRAFVKLLAEEQPDPDLLYPPGIDSWARVAEDASIDPSAAVGPFCVIGPGVEIGPGTRLGPHVVLEAGARVGRDCLLHAQVTVRHGCLVGDRVIIHSGAVIGSDGFGYLPGPAGMEKIPQVGIAVLEDDVEIGAGACVDRAKVGRTVVGRGSKIDNLVQIGHNVKIGSHCALSAQVGIAGTTVLGDGVTAGGQVGIADHLTVGDGARLAGKSGIWRDVPPGATLFGYPALNIKEAFRIASAMRRLPELMRKLDATERKRPPEEDDS